MIMAARGIETTERELVQAADMQVGGLNPDELSQLALRLGIDAEARQLTLTDIANLLANQQFPITFLYRKPLDRVAAIHAVIPFRLTPRFAYFLDPLRGERRVTRRKFEEARRWVDRWCVVFEAE
jgi:ABC-type bacteriocin/lantibiotic exporter with double-glycine peptidase domain